MSANTSLTLYRMILLAERITGHDVTVEYSGKRDEVIVSVYRGGYRMGHPNVLDQYSTTEYSINTIYSILMDLAYEESAAGLSGAMEVAGA